MIIGGEIMNYPDYDEYMRSLMGYPNMRTSMNQSMNSGMNQFSNIDAYADDLERMYPETYRVIYPMVCFACDNIRTPVTEESIDMMTDDIYDRVEADGRMNIDISIDVRNEEESQENRQRMPRRRNRFLRDLIRILLLRELIRRRHPRFPMRPF